MKKVCRWMSISLCFLVSFGQSISIGQQTDDMPMVIPEATVPSSQPAAPSGGHTPMSVQTALPGARQMPMQPAPTAAQTPASAQPAPTAAQTPASAQHAPTAAQSPVSAQPVPTAAQAPASTQFAPTATQVPASAQPAPIAAQAPASAQPVPSATQAITTVSNSVSPPSADLVSKTYSLLQISGLNGFIFKSINASNLLYLPINPQWDIQSIDLHLTLYRATFQDKATNMSAFITDIPISSMQLMGGSADRTNWDITIPQNDISGNLLSVKISSYSPEKGYNCTITDTGSWVYITSNSTITYHYSIKPYVPDLRKFPYPFINTQSLDKDSAYLITNSNINTNTLESMLYVANTLGRAQTWRGLDLIVDSLEKLNDAQKASKNIILVGTAQDLNLSKLPVTWPVTIDKNTNILVKDGQTIPTDQGIIMLAKSPWNPQFAVMAITGNSDAAVKKAGKKLRDPNLINNIMYPEYISVNQVSDDATSSSTEEPIILANLGEGDRVVNGVGENSINYTLDLSRENVIDYIYANVQYATSPFLTHNSTLSLKVNDLPVTGISLIKGNNPYSWWKVRIPHNFIVPGLNTISFIYALHLPVENCSPSEADTAWGVIGKETSFDITYSGKKAIPSISALASYMTNNLIIAIPLDKSETTPYNKQNLVNLLKYLNKVTDIKVIGNNQITKEDLTNNDVIYIGYTQLVDLLKKEKIVLPLYFANNKLNINPLFINTLSLSDETPVSISELIYSPFNSNKLIFFISSSSIAGYQNALDTIIQSEKRQIINGNIVVNYPNGTFTTLNALPATGGERFFDYRKHSLAIAISSSIILLLIAFVLFKLLVRKRDK